MYNYHAELGGHSGMLLHLAPLFTIMPAPSGYFTSLRKLATLTVVVVALCCLADAANPTCNAGFNWVGSHSYK